MKREDSERVRIVHFDHFNSNISWSCKKFESLGILCCRALRVFNLKNLIKISSQYILKCWTKEAKKGMMAYEQDNHSSGNNAKGAETMWIQIFFILLRIQDVPSVSFFAILAICVLGT